MTVQNTAAASQPQTIGGKTYSNEEIAAILKAKEAEGAIAVLTDDPMDKACEDLKAAARVKDRGRGVEALGGVLGSFFTVYNISSPPSVDKAGAPKREGSVESAVIVSTELGTHPTAALTTHVSAADLSAQADTSAFGFGVSDLLTTAQTRLGNYLAPITRKMVDSVRLGAQALLPFAGSDLELTLKLDRVNTYLKDAYKKGVQTRQRNKKKDQKAMTTAEQKIGAQARDNARTEAVAAVNDKIKTLL